MESERKILEYWKEKDIFKKTLEKTKNGKPFVFYDGPPFATGEPHYGHILPGTIKDVIPRYQTMKGRFVRRQWGWDCHGLPLENIIEDELKLKHKKDIESFGIGNFNEAARKAVLRFESTWREVMPRAGRFVDMENAYKTMDANYSESIWWAFKTLYDKGLAYEGHKVMYVCPRCETAVSNFEVAQGYKDITDISATAKFELTDEPGTYLLAWTTTPWTLPGNVALAVNPDIEYVKVKIADVFYVLAKERLAVLAAGYEIINSLRGKELIGKSYKPLFDYYSVDKDLKNREQGWKIYGADFVNTEDGTGIVHIAPAFGEDDMNLAHEHNLPIVQHVSIDGKFKPEVKDFAGMYVKQKGDTQSADIEVIKNLAHRNLLFAKEKITHSYPLCWRCETPLINYATPSWFVKVTKFRDKLVRENKKIRWVPEHIGAGRFGKWLEGARDWAISRTRFWGAPLPVWRCEKCKKIEIFGSLRELQTKLPKSSNRYFIMRHGEAQSNIDGVIDSYGDPKNHLTEKGVEQAKKSAQVLKKSAITKIFTSPLIRAKETADIVAKELGLSEKSVIADKRFSEFDHGEELQGEKSIDKLTDASELGNLITHLKGSETLLDLRHRMLNALFEIDKRHKNENILIVTHGSPVWMLLTGIANLNERGTFEFRRKRENGRGYFIKNTEPEEFIFKPFPHNNNGELDFHRPYIDEVVWDCGCGGLMKRIPDVFDCWFESGSMPYAQFHYPFENKNEFKQNFPAEFIAEGVDQTRGWFYSLIVLGTALFGESPYKNVIVNGTILAGDGQKMSKRLKNYPDPMAVVEKYGADALRFYMVSSPMVRGEDSNFSEKNIDEVYKKNVSRLNNVYAFYGLYRGNEEGNAKSNNVLDKWIIARLNQVINETSTALDSYELDKATRPLGEFIDDLSTWYIRRSRDRFKGDDEADKKLALGTTKYVLTEFSKVLAPFMPFLADDLYLKVTVGEKEESVHLENWPGNNRQPTTNDQRLIADMGKTRKIVELALAKRAEAGIKVRQPISKLKVKSEKLKDEYTGLIKDEVNVKEIVFDEKMTNEIEIDVKITPELKEEGDLRDLIRQIQDFRKEKGLKPSDKAALLVYGDEAMADLVKRNQSRLERATSLSYISVSKSDKGTSFQILNPET